MKILEKGLSKLFCFQNMIPIREIEERDLSNTDAFFILGEIDDDPNTV
jgi:hypothetical protein